MGFFSQPKPQPKAPAPPPTLGERLNGADLNVGVATNAFMQAAEDLDRASAEYAEIKADAENEILQLQEIAYKASANAERSQQIATRMREFVQ